MQNFSNTTYLVSDIRLLAMTNILKNKKKMQGWECQIKHTRYG